MRFLFILIFLLFATIAFSQKVAVGLPAMNVIYIGLKNEVTVAVEGYKNSDLVLLMSPHTHIAQEGEKLYIKPIIRGDAYLYVGVKQNTDTLWLDTAHFRVRRIPVPRPMFGTLQDGDVQTIGTIKANAIRTFMSLGEGFAVEGIKAVITRYNFGFIDSLGYNSVVSQGSEIPLTARRWISTMSPGAKIVLNGFEYYLKNDEESILYPSVHNDKKVVITARPVSNNPFTKTEEQLEALYNFSPTYNIKGGFVDSGMRFNYKALFTRDDYLERFTKRVKHDVWQYTTGINDERVYMEEYYDSGKITRYVVYDSAANKVIDAKKEAKTDSMFIRELYSNGKMKREGWVYTDFDKYIFWGELSKSYHGTLAQNPYRKFYEEMKFMPVGIWKEYHPNGKLKLEAYFKTIVDMVYSSYLDTHKSKGYNIVFDGLWKEYDIQGKLINKYVYKDGYYDWDLK
jgi:antitoxin component YwqK of YwqJK toxin-antitoxin module